MYAGIIREPDAGAVICGYVATVDIPVPLRARFGRALRAIDPRVIDAFIGTAFTVIGIFGLARINDPTNVFRSSDALGYTLTLFCALPYFVRRRAPVAVLLTSAAAVVLLALLDYQISVQSQFLLVGAFTVGAHSEGSRRVVGLVGLGVGVAIVAIVGIPDTNAVNLALIGAVYAAAFLFGSTVRNRRLYTGELEQRAELLLRERDEQSRRAIADERLRIAQELHDVVAHSMGVIAVQAGVGEHVIDNDPDEAKRALAAIATTSRSTLTEIRRLLGVLRDDDGVEHAPAPGLVDLPRLVAATESAGLKVELHFKGEPFELPPGIDLTAYRIVQEGLTNVLKHAGPTTARVVIASESDVLRLEITDDGRGVNARAVPGGHGLLGMRERVAVYGGTLETGPRAGGGYRVAAQIPYGPEQ